MFMSPMPIFLRHYRNTSARDARLKYRHAARFGLFCLLALSVLFLQSCSIVLDFDQCETDSDCPTAGVCTDGICKEPPTVEISSHITEDTTWTADNVYILTDIIMVSEPAVLTIEPGTLILAEQNAALIFDAGARIDAVGTREKPIVFTSAKGEGKRYAGDWAGVALIGKARVNREKFQLRIDGEMQEPLVGGNDDTWNCGAMKYVRIEFGGGYIAGNNALDGLTLAGCGSDTLIDYIQVHQGADDNIQLFGGTVDLRHVVLTQAKDDPLDIDTGWRGTAQFVAVQQSSIGSNSLEIRGLKEDHDAEPRTDIKIYNYTLIGGDGSGDAQRGAHIREGASAFLSHGIIMGHHTVGIEVSDASSIELANDDKNVVQHTLFYNVGQNNDDYFADSCAFVDPETPGECDPADAATDDNVVAFMGSEYFTQAQFANVFGKDPGIERPNDLQNPSWVPSGEHTSGDSIPPPPSGEGFDPKAVYLGAFAPGEIPWTEGWTAYPQN